MIWLLIALAFALPLLGAALVAVPLLKRSRSHVVEAARRVLVLANRGLERGDLVERLRALAGEGPTEVWVVAPIAPVWHLREFDGDADEQRAEAGVRVDEALVRLRRAGVSASGHVSAELGPANALAAAAGKVEPDEIFLVPSTEPGWHRALTLADAVRGAGIGVTKLLAAPRLSALG